MGCCYNKTVVFLFAVSSLLSQVLYTWSPHTYLAPLQGGTGSPLLPMLFAIPVGQDSHIVVQATSFLKFRPCLVLIVLQVNLSQRFVIFLYMEEGVSSLFSTTVAAPTTR